MVTVLCRQRCRDALVVWKEEQTLLDGHNRHDICTKHGLPYKTVELSLPDMHAAKVWMIDNQLGRRNLTEGQMRLLRGMRYELEKQAVGRPEKQCAQNEHNPERTAEKLSQQYKVSPATIRRDAEYASDIKVIAAVAATEGSSIVAATEGKLGRKEVKELATLATEKPEAAKEVIQSLDSIDKPRVAKAVVQKAVAEIIEHGELPADTAKLVQQEQPELSNGQAGCALPLYTLWGMAEDVQPQPSYCCGCHPSPIMHCL
jgi:hypothetical protein